MYIGGKTATMDIMELQFCRDLEHFMTGSQ